MKDYTKALTNVGAVSPKGADSRPNIHLRVERKSKAIWVKLAQQEGLTLTQWIESRLNACVQEEIVQGSLTAPDWMDGLSPRIQQCFLREGITTPEELHHNLKTHGEGFLFSLPNFSKKCMPIFDSWYKDHFC